MIADYTQIVQSRTTDNGVEEGFAAALADPLWLLGRQWQMGERRGHDGGKAARASFATVERDIEPLAGHDPRNVPLEPILEGRTEDWWTPGRRVRIGRRVEKASPALLVHSELFLSGLPTPYERLDGSGLDGLLVWQMRGTLGLSDDIFGQTPAFERTDFFDRGNFSHAAQAIAGPITLSARDHTGGAVDWYSFDGEGALDAIAEPVPAEDRRHVFVRPVRLPGTPDRRWWSIGDIDRDIAALGVTPDRAGMSLLLTLMASTRDSFTLPVSSRAGRIVRVGGVEVLDSFGERKPYSAPGSNDGRGFAITGLSADHVLLVAPAPLPLVGPVLDEIALAPDELANLVWAVERRVGGRDRAKRLPASGAPTTPRRSVVGGGEEYHYAHASPPRPSFVPYVADETLPAGTWLVQGIVDAPDGTRSEATSDLLLPEDNIVHRLRRGAIAPLGVEIVTRYKLLRDSDGKPVLWRERRRRRARTRPERLFLFDLLQG